MGRYILGRLVAVVPILLIVSAAAFALRLLLPGDPAAVLAGEAASPERIDRIRQALHLDDPYFVGYFRWLGDLIQGDLGTSGYTGRPIIEDLVPRLAVTGSLGVLSILLSVVVGAIIALLQTAFRDTWVDRGLLVVTSLGMSIPSFWLGTIFVTIFAVQLHILPSFGYVDFQTSPGEWLRRMILPVATLSIVMAADLSRLLRAALVTEADQDYARTAAAKGIGTMRVITGHVLRNAAPPVLATLGIRIAYLVAGAVIIESIFGLPGVGLYTIQAVQNRDLGAIQAIVLLSAVVTVLINLFVDVVNAILNPKVRIAA